MCIRDRAYSEIKEDPVKAAVWQPIIAKYNPTLVGECEKAIDWSEKMVENWLDRNMLSNEPDKKKLIDNIIKELGDHAVNKSHARHLSMQKCEDIGLKIIEMESDHELQDLILSIHHICIHTLNATNAFKIIENQDGIAFIQSLKI